ncbi:non sense mediated decay [Hyphodiscus hymeniophilus]|uniref:Non sense mediated decay n=1 Tax=Hyphodiscus hymeniophilus TaxID=353542 RepID=A0A9P6VGW1_9HELO|nr:non sense mediated decay [Hyphodiscus hymeniophilus]
MPSTNSTATSLTTIVLLLGLLLVSLFPGLFHLLWTILLAIITPSTYIPQPTHAPSSYLTPSTANIMSWFQKSITLPSKSRGSYLVTDTIVRELPELKNYKIGLLNLFVQHTSCALSLNENWDEDVREDMSDALDRIAPEDRKGDLYRHSAEGLDDMPAHIKSALIGASITIPIKDGKLATGTWQGIWYLEFRASKHQRKVVATIQGEKM